MEFALKFSGRVLRTTSPHHCSKEIKSKMKSTKDQATAEEFGRLKTQNLRVPPVLSMIVVSRCTKSGFFWRDLGMLNPILSNVSRSWSHFSLPRSPFRQYSFSLSYQPSFSTSSQVLSIRSLFLSAVLLVQAHELNRLLLPL